MLKGVIFDLDGTLTLTEELHYKAYSAVFKEYGVNDFTYEEEISKYAGSGSRNIFTKVFENRGVKVSPEEIEKCIEKKHALYTKIIQEEEIPVVAGALEFVKMLQARGFKKIIATGNSDLDAVRFVLKRAGLLEYFPDIISIKEVPMGKPFPDVFIEAARRISCTPNECVVFEDAVNGVDAAVSAGISCIALGTTTKKEDLLNHRASNVIPDYTQIIDNVMFYETAPMV